MSFVPRRRGSSSETKRGGNRSNRGGRGKTRGGGREYSNGERWGPPEPASSHSSLLGVDVMADARKAALEEFERRAEREAIDRVARAKAMGALFRDYNQLQDEARTIDTPHEMGPERRMKESEEMALLPRDLLRSTPQALDDAESVEAIGSRLRELLAFEPIDESRLERYARRGERLLRKSSERSEAWRFLCIAVGEARGRLAILSSDDEIAASHARAAWAAHYKRLEVGLSALKRRETIDASSVLADAAEASELFARLLERLLAMDSKPATAHALLMALGDLERYRESYGPDVATEESRHSRADALYLRALRLKPTSGRAAGMLATLASLRSESAIVVHWARRAAVATEPWEGARELMLSHAERCKRKGNELLAAKPRGGRNLRATLAECEVHVSAFAAACFTRVSGTGGLRATVDRHASAGVALAALDDEDDGAKRQYTRHARWARRLCLRCTLTAILAIRCVIHNDEAPEVVASTLAAALCLVSAFSKLGAPLAVSSVLAMLSFLNTDVAIDDVPLANVKLDATVRDSVAEAIAGFLNDLEEVDGDEDEEGVDDTRRVLVDDDELCCGVLESTMTDGIEDRARLRDQDGPRARAERSMRCIQVAEQLVALDNERALLTRVNTSAPSRRRVDHTTVQTARFAPYKHHSLTAVFKALDLEDSLDGEDSSDLIQEEELADGDEASFSANSSEALDEPQPAPEESAEDEDIRAASRRTRRRRATSPPIRRRPKPKPVLQAQETSEPAIAGVRLGAMAPLPPQAFTTIKSSPRTGPPDAEEPHAKLLFVIDAANVAMRFGQKGAFCTRGIAVTMEYLERRFEGRCRFAMFLPEYMLDSEKVAAKRRAHDLGIKQAKVQELPDDVLYLQNLEREGILVSTPSQDYDDSYQIEYARRHAGVIVTNDMFRDAVDKLKPHLRGALREWMKTHLLSYTFVGDEFVPNPDFQFPVTVRIAKKKADDAVVRRGVGPPASAA